VTVGWQTADPVTFIRGNLQCATSRRLLVLALVRPVTGQGLACYSIGTPSKLASQLMQNRALGGVLGAPRCGWKSRTQGEECAEGMSLPAVVVSRDTRLNDSSFTIMFNASLVFPFESGDNPHENQHHGLPELMSYTMHRIRCSGHWRNHISVESHRT